MKHMYRALPILLLLFIAAPVAAQDASSLRGASSALADGTAAEVAPEETTAPVAAAVEAAAAAADDKPADPEELGADSEWGDFISALMGAVAAGNAGEYTLMVMFIIFLLVGLYKKVGAQYVKLSKEWNIVVSVAIGVLLAVATALGSGPFSWGAIVSAALAGGVNGLAAGGLYDATKLVKKKEAA